MTQEEKKFLTLTEACKYMGISKSHMYKLTSQKKIGHYKPNGKMCYFKKSDLDKFVLQNRIQPK